MRQNMYIPEGTPNIVVVLVGETAIAIMQLKKKYMKKEMQNSHIARPFKQKKTIHAPDNREASLSGSFIYISF